MRKVVIVRIGLPMPHPAVSAALKPHIANPETAQMFPNPGGIISVFDTESTDEQIANDIRTQSDAFFFVFGLNEQAFRLPEPVMQSLARVHGLSAEPTAPEAQTELTIDQILEKVHDLGMESLTPAEKAILERGN